ncbi:MAG: hypothetical protein CMI09_09420 [Oceanospirillaceae bacterium]|nr:hypothetical protein [Oceanospirillaceae bacterium]
MRTFQLPFVRRGIKAAFTAVVLACLSVSALALDPAGETVTIRNDGKQTYYEFRVNGEIVEIKVVPKVGPSYYLVPAEEQNGDFVRKDNPEIRVPSWVIFRW